MKTNDWLQYATQKLHSAKIDTARLDCLVLLEDALNTNRTQLLAEPDTLLTDEQQTVLDAQLAKRCRHTPLAYIRGKVEFYGRTFLVNEHVLVPRPESEVMVELFSQLQLKQHVKLADIGTGSGALGITAALESGLEHVYLHDIDANALEVARKNSQLHKVTATCVLKNLVNDYNTNYDVLLCNLPYVPTGYPINEAATHEPELALYGGDDGLDLYRELFKQVDEQATKKPQYILTEALPEQHTLLAHIARDSGFTQKTSQEFIQVFKSSD
jgi:release factor glutamine methyltransferase